MFATLVPVSDRLQNVSRRFVTMQASIEWLAVVCTGAAAAGVCLHASVHCDCLHGHHPAPAGGPQVRSLSTFTPACTQAQALSLM